jgi:hypothetical protein
MSFFANLAHQISASAADAPRRSFSVSVVHAEDVDDFVEKLRGYQLQLTQIDKGPFAAKIVQTELAGVLLTAAQYGRSLIHAGEPPSGKIAFAMGKSRLPARWQGQDFGSYDLLVSPTSGSEIDLVTQAGFGCATASFAPDIVNATADRLGLPPIGDFTNIALIPLERNNARMLRAAFEAAFSDAVVRPRSDRAAAWSVTKQEDMLRFLLSCAANATSETMPATASGPAS